MSELIHNDEILSVVSGIIKKVTGNPDITVDRMDTADDIKNWDSLRHVMIINEIEDYFSIRFDLTEMLDINNVGDICKAILNKKSKA
ncbi:MAG: acyl carrier protein [Bacteroidales bacterium]|nr:acyl carrier protein [Bacteroidales bacterium]